ncbi:DNA topoisomerase 3-alpha [Dissophora globulifera]|uniref:DNA topoisomerase n=1 Tax=Dissophora globulifera TaxID=979702 RepID=A0A9P6RKZ6_9FUNG|nr:DNA topoisomerase 3-alpha [Dissophora globulifera]
MDRMRAGGTLRDRAAQEHIRGTDTTASDHIKIILKRNYVQRDRQGEENVLVPSALGIALVEAYNRIAPEMGLSQPFLRSQFERNLWRTCAGEKTKAEVVRKAVNMYKNMFEIVNREQRVLHEKINIQNRFPGLDGIIGYGSCQFPTLGFIVERYLRRERYIPENFRMIEMVHSRDGNEVSFTWQRGRLFDELVCLMIYEACLEGVETKAVITRVKSEPTSKW